MPLPSGRRKLIKMKDSKIFHVEDASYAVEVFDNGTIGIHVFQGRMRDNPEMSFYGGYVTVDVSKSPFGAGYMSLPLKMRDDKGDAHDVIYEESAAKKEAKRLLKSQVGILKNTLKQAFDKDADIAEFLQDLAREYPKQFNTLDDLFR